MGAFHVHAQDHAALEEESQKQHREMAMKKVLGTVTMSNVLQRCSCTALRDLSRRGRKTRSLPRRLYARRNAQQQSRKKSRPRRP